MFDIRTVKPNGDPWDFDKRADRLEARRIVEEKQPKWIIGSPPCTAWCILNYGLTYRKMDPEKVKAMMAEGRRHLRCVASLYRH